MFLSAAPGRVLQTIASCAIVACAASLQAATPVTYYDTANTASGATLRASLNDIVTAGAVQIGYSNTNGALYVTDEDPGNSNNVLMVYGRDSRPKSSSSGSADGSAVTGGWNREHCFPQSYFNSNEPMESDIHSLMPSDADINSRRSNDGFDTVASPVYTDVFGNKSDNTRFEPANIDKGRVARAIMYMDIRYEGEGSNPNLSINNSGPTTNQMAWLNTLLAWHRQYPPSAFERLRNYKVHNRQHNANPFVDRPEWASVIFGGTAWTMADNDTITVSGTNRTPLTSQSAGAQNIPLLSLNLNLAANQFHIGTLAVSKLGTVLDSEVSAVKLWLDVDNNGAATSADTLLDTRTLASGAANFDLTAHPFYVAPGTMNLLVTASLAGSVAGSRTLGVRAGSNGIFHHASGGNDIDPVFADLDSGLVIVQGSVANGDALTAVTATNRALLSAQAGSIDVPMLSLNLTLGANEWDLGQVNVSELGTSTDSDISQLSLYLDTNNNGAADAADTLLDTTALSGGAASFVLGTPYRILPGTKNFLVTANIAPGATVGSTVQIRINANGILSSPTGGVDTNPANANLDSTATNITEAPAGGGTANLVISEVYEGNGGNLKYVEVHNPTTGTISLDSPKDYVLRIYVNGGITPFATINIAGSIPAGGYFVVVNNAADFDAMFSSSLRDQISGSISHNGNDCYDLYNATDGVVDTFAGDNLGNTPNFAINVVALRKLSELPNSGAWGGNTQPAANQDSPSGFWATRAISASNANASLIGNPGDPGVPVGLSGFEAE
jgi:endonuclease I